MIVFSSQPSEYKVKTDYTVLTVITNYKSQVEILPKSAKSNLGCTLGAFSAVHPENKHVTFEYITVIVIIIL